MTSKETIAFNPEASISPDSAVLQLINTLGNTVGERIKTTAMENPKLRRVMFTGLPGSGKTTILEGSNRILAPEYLRPREVRSFDAFRANFLNRCREKGIEANVLADLPPQENAYFGDYLTTMFEDTNYVGYSDSEHPLMLIEAPAIGQLERGQAALKRWGEAIKRTGKQRPDGSLEHQIDTLVVCLIADERVSNTAKQTRQIATECDDDLELITRLASMGISITKPDKKLHKGKTQLIENFSRMASAGMIDDITAEIAESVEENYTRIQEQSGYLLNLVKAHIHLPKTVTVRDSQEWERLIKHALYYHTIMNSYGFPPDAYMVAINQFAGGIRY